MNDLISTLRRRWPAVAVGVIAAILLIALGVQNNPSSDRTVNPSGSAATSGQTSGGLPQVAIQDLPPEARTTIELIDQGGPYPYDEDDSDFQNREGHLPQAPSGTYREYTVRTPGESDRGARRIVKARDGTLYYTDDHYESFTQVKR
ncbi:ribonuclease domain-containing protein [Demetria terragena]|uniref:ribonuclease domain-containing protein n=1 Tax=Demetria terragena TaxID=63959 RepID=UPI00035DFD81|nr:ribonuclease domain-containing protein [Demetria terragena]